jgi:hypothetical protein
MIAFGGRLVLPETHLLPQWRDLGAARLKCPASRVRGV